MLVVRPFRGIVYNKGKVGDIGKVVAPPYDVITPPQQEFYHKLHPYNIVRLILGREKEGDSAEDNKYIRARDYFRSWLSQGVLSKQPIPSLYTYYQRYVVEGEEVERKGFIALMRLEEFSSGLVLPHEQVFPEPQKDRLYLMRACRANFSAIFSLFADPERKIDTLLEQAKPLYKCKDREGVEHTLSSIQDPQIVDTVCSLMKDKKVFIADGHHRYLTALRFRDEVKRGSHPPAGAEYVMMYFLNMSSPGVTILPVHRLVGGLSPQEEDRAVRRIDKFFYKKPFRSRGFQDNEKKQAKAKQLLSEIKKRGEQVFGMYTEKEGFFLLLPKNPDTFSGKIKSAVLDELIREVVGEKRLKKGKDIDFTTHTTDAVEEVQTGAFQIVFFLTPTTVDEIKKVALSGGKMPPKSSYFYPKLLSGLVMRDVEDAI